MFRYTLAMFVILHGLIHLWHFRLSRRRVVIKPELGWSGRSWLLTPLLGETATRSAASVGYLLATFAFVASGAGLMVRLEWWRPLLMDAALLSSALLILMWDGRWQQLVKKGLIGALISLAIVALIGLK